LLLHVPPANPQGWLAEPDDERDHPGARQRRAYQPSKGKRKAMTAGTSSNRQQQLKSEGLRPRMQPIT
jgi:hypothetical protein